MDRKRRNTILFILGATVFNIVVMVGLFVAMFAAFAAFVAPSLSAGANNVLLLAIFVASIVLTYVAYHRIIKRLSAHFTLEDHFDSLFRSRSNRH